MLVINLKNMYTNDFEKLVEKEMDAPIKHFERELATIRTGRAHPALVEDIKGNRLRRHTNGHQRDRRNLNSGSA